MFARQLLLRGLVGANLALAAVATVLGPAQAGQSTSLPGTLELRNRRWEQVRVEVRVGPSKNCEENDPQGPAVLRRDESWAVVSNEVVCWRRDQVPGDPSTGWTVWEQSQLASDQVRKVTL